MNHDYMNMKDNFGKRSYEEDEWFEFYVDLKEEVRDNAPAALGKGVEITRYLDADHSGDHLTRHSHTGILIFVNLVPIVWCSKCQSTMESSTFGSEVVALRTYLDIAKGLWYKICIMGVTINGPD